jgi:hypothetical protein
MLTANPTDATVYPDRHHASAVALMLNMYAEDDVTYNVTENPDGTATIAKFDATSTFVGHYKE